MHHVREGGMMNDDMVPDDRSSTTAAAGFDLQTETGLMQVLQVVRASSLDVNTKRDLRDLIFSYTSSKDAGILSEISAQLTNLGIRPAVVAVTDATQEPVQTPAPAPEFAPTLHLDTPVPPPAVESTSPTLVGIPQYGFGGGRPTPSFGAPRVAPSVTADVPPNLPTADATPVAIRIVPTITPNLSYVGSKPAETSSAVPVPSTPVETEVAEVVPPPIPPTPPTPPSVPNVRSRADFGERIQVIKSTINNKVGNPVNLINLDQTVGREYMSALLEAMKAVSNANNTDADVQSAMMRLETVFVTAEGLLNQTNPNPDLVVPNTPIPPSVPVVPDTPSKWVTPAPTVPVVPEPPVISPIVPVIPPGTDLAMQMKPVSQLESDVQPVAITSSRLAPLPVGAATPLKVPGDLPTIDDIKQQSGNTDPLHAAEVDSGLEQLLSEWALFKKSGMFGTGPKGRQHPLFLKLAPLTVPLILSGRFEGATQEIRQSVTDYMNGWRYEQGIIYNNDETFELYLRRVIRHILDLQSKRRSP